MRKYWKLIALATFLLLIIIINFSNYLSFVNLHVLSTHYLFIEKFIFYNFYIAALIFIAMYVLAVIIVMPGAWLLTFAGGFFFGWVIGTVITVIGATIGACLLYIFSKTIIGNYLNKKIKDNSVLFVRFEKNIKDNAFFYLLFMRLMPLFPFVFVNVAPALVGIKFLTYFLATIFGIIPGTLIYSILGSGANDLFTTGNVFHIRDLITYEIIIGLAGISFLSLIPIFLKNKYRLK